MSPATARHRTMTRGTFASAQMRRTASTSRSETAGKPASTTSTPASARALAMATLSSTEKCTPGICAPSRRVVSEMMSGLSPLREDCAGRVDMRPLMRPFALKGNVARFLGF